MRKPKTFTKTYAKVCSLESCKKPFATVYSYQKFCSPECCFKSNLEATKAKYKTHRIAKEPTENTPKLIQEFICLWCHSKFKAVRSKTQIYCCHECGYDYRKMREKICNKYPFEHDKVDAEFERLKVLGQNYVLEAIC